MSDTKTYKVAVIYSSWSIQSITDKLSEYGSSDDFAMLRVDRHKGEETNRTICLMDSDFFDSMISSGYDRRKYGEDFSMTEYQIRDHNYPKEGETDSLYIPLPKSLTGAECQQQMQRKLDTICGFGVCTVDDIKINIPMKSRDTGEHNGLLFLSVKKELPKECITVFKILIHDTWWYTSDDERVSLCRCYWARERKAPESEGTDSNTEQPKQKAFYKHEEKKVPAKSKQETSKQESSE